MRLSLATLALALVVQAPPRPPQDEFRHQLDALKKELRSPTIPTGDRERRLRAFLRAHRSDPRLVPSERRRLLVRLAQFELVGRDANAALQRFRLVSGQCPRSDLDVRARCELGIAQALELRGERGDRERAAVRYGEVIRLFEGTRYARVARHGLARLRRRARELVGRPLVLAEGLRTIDGKELPPVGSHRWWLVFFLPSTARELPASMRPLVRVRGDVHLLLFVADQALAKAWQERLGKRASVLAQAVHRDLGIGVLPAWLLVDATGRVVDLDPPLRRVRRLVEGGGR